MKIMKLTRKIGADVKKEKKISEFPISVNVVG
jgi:hypothetical protein